MIGRFFLKELKGTVGVTVGVYLILMMIGNWYLLSRIGVWPDEAVLRLASLQLVLPFLWCTVMAFHILYSEWNTHTVYLLLSLPVGGITIITVKAASLLLGFTCLYGTGVAGFQYLFRPLLGKTVMGAVLGLELFYIWILLGVMIGITQLAFLLSRKFSKYRGAYMCLFFWIGMWLLKMGSTLLAPLCKWATLKFHLSPVEVYTATERGLSLTVKTGLQIHLFIGVCLIGVLWFCNGWLLEKKAGL